MRCHSPLAALNVDIKQQLRVIVVSHWHNDHMRGAAELVKQASEATLNCSAALQAKEFYRLVSASTRERVGTSDLPEFAEIFRILKERNPHSKVPSTGLEWVKSDQTIFGRSVTAEHQGALVHALSPSSDTLTVAHLEFAGFLPEYRAPKRRPIAISPNRVAVTLWVRFGDARVLLGSDLEECGVPTMGWQGILASTIRPTDHVQIFKVPHHGSQTAHNDDVWEQMVQPGAVAIMTPYLSGPKPL
jgi:beta-lactamase superfamily II metal-dependent hydrolase